MFQKRLWIVFLTFFILAPAVWGDTAQDVLIGNGTTGPYSLSRKEIALGTEMVRMNSLAQTRGLDYMLDADAGTITFTRSLPSQSAVEVRYIYDPARAVRTNPNLTIPLAFDLARGEHGNLSLDAVYKHSGPLSDVSAGALAVGLGGGWQTGATQLETRLLFAPALTADSQPAFSDSLSRIGVSVSDVSQASRVARFSFGFSRIGTNLGQAAEDNGWQAGTQDLTLSAEVTPAKTFQLATHWTHATDSGASTGSGDISVSAQPTASSQLAASFSAKDAPGTSNDGQVVGLSAKLVPLKAITFNADAGRTTQAGVSTVHQLVSLVLAPHAPFQIQTGLLLRQTEQYSTSAATVGGTFQPASFVQFSGAYTDRAASPADAAVQDSLDTSTVQVALTPLRGVRFTGNYAQNPADSGTPQHLAQHSLGLVTNLGSLSLTGGYDWACQYDSATIGTTLNLGLGVRVSRALQITGGYKQTLTGIGDVPIGTSLYTIGLTHNLSDRFNLSMNGTRQQNVGPATPAAASEYTASANLGMKF
jgi:hypothetical protein